ncbi:MAG: KilA-N domain-containing protein [Maribacter sp.]
MYIYLFEYEDICKVGVSFDPTRRIKAFPFMNEVISKKMVNARCLESDIIEIFKDKSIGGEFFKDCKEEIKKYILDSLELKDDLLSVKQIQIGDYECLFDKKTGFFNITDFYNKLVLNDRIYSPQPIANIIKNKNISMFIEDFENKFDFCPIFKVYGRSGGTYVHLYLFSEIINILNLNKEKVSVYELMYNTDIGIDVLKLKNDDAIRIGIKKALEYDKKGR